jgi:hypothetical protein
MAPKETEGHRRMITNDEVGASYIGILGEVIVDCELGILD